MASTRLYLVRHGATDLTAEDRFSGANGDLSDEGRRQIEKLGARLRGAGIQALYASDLPRALDSACILGRAIGLEPIPRPALREIRHGHWEGLTHAEVAARYGAEYAAWQADPFDRAPSGGESGAAVLARAGPALREIAAAHPGARALAVSHKATLRLLLCDLLGMDPRGYRDRLDQAPACLDIAELPEEGPPRIVLLNDTSHYSP